jgi:hypothetical protein
LKKWSGQLCWLALEVSDSFGFVSLLAAAASISPRMHHADTAHQNKLKTALRHA